LPVREKANWDARDAPVDAGGAIAAAGHVPRPGVPWANQLRAIEKALTERPAIVRAVVVDGVQHTVDIRQRVPALAGLDLPDRTGWNVPDVGDRYIVRLSN
jgi:hypothetical protein